MQEIKRILAALLFTAVACTLNAQFTQRGGIDGFVQDPSSAAIPGAQVVMTNIADNQRRVLASGPTGTYAFTDLVPGSYKIVVSAPGFAGASVENVAVVIGRSTRVDVSLHPGKASESVTVNSVSAALHTGQTDISTEVSQQQINSLPLNGRNFTAVAALAAGVSTTPAANINPGGTYAVGATFAVGGTSFTTGGVVEGSRDNGFYINGVNITENYESSISYAPSPDALSEASIQVADLSAANGHDISTLSLQTRAGTTKFHGQAYDYLENDAFNAVNPFIKAESLLNGLQVVKPVLRRNQYGGGLGGPAYIPGLPLLRRKGFFFVNYENFTERDGSEPVFASVPSTAERSGDFSELLGGTNPTQLYNPYFTTYNGQGQSTRPVIPNNRLDLAERQDGSPLVDPNTAKLLALYPQPNISGVPSYQPNYHTTESLGLSNYHLDTRFDATPTDKDHLFVTWSRSLGDNNNTGGLAPSQLYLTNIDDRAWLVTANYARVLTPNLTNEFIFGIGNGALINVPPSQLAFYNSPANPFNQIFQNTGPGITHGVLAMQVYNYASPGITQVFRSENRTLQFSDNVNWVRGRHTLNMGGNFFRKGEYDWDFIRYVTFGQGSSSQGSPRQEFTSGGYTQNYAGGDGIADLVIGAPRVLHQRYNYQGGDATAPELNVYFPYWGFYGNDKIQINRKLTLSLGLRWDLSVPLYAANNICCAVYNSTPDGGVLQIPGFAQGLPQHYLSTPKKDFAPRVSFAYSVNEKTVLRGGYGIFFDAGATQISIELANALNSIPGYSIGDEITNVTQGYPSDTPALTTANVFQAAPNLTPGEYPVSTGPGEGYFGANALTQVYYFDQKSTALPYYQRFILDVQRQLSGQDSLTLSYAGVQGRKGWNYVNTNLPPYQTGWPTLDAFDAARPNNAGRFSDIYVQRPVLNTFYNAGIVQYQHTFAHGFQAISSYTWAKTVSDYPVQNNVAGGAVTFGPFSGFQYPNVYNRGEANFSHRHRFVYSGVLQPAYGNTWPVWARTAFGGWRLSAIGTIESGDALTVVNVATTAADYAGLDQLAIAAHSNPNLSHGNRSFAQQFTVSAYSAPPNGVRGNSGLGTVRGPGQNNVDLSLAKVFEVEGPLRVEFRADAFNAFNHTQWNGAQTTYPSAPVASYGNIPFGQVSGAREARIAQFGLKVAF